MRQCTTCGAESDDSAVVCSHCGRYLEPAAAAAAPPPPSEPTPGFPPPPPAGPPGTMPPPIPGVGPDGPPNLYQQQPPGYGPPPGYGQPGAYGPPPGPYGMAAPGTLATWGPRALGWLIDFAFVIVIVIFIVSTILGHASEALGLLLELVVIAVSIYLAIQVGQTGQSPGMRVVGLKCIGERTGQPIGGGLGFVRSLAHLVDSLICYVGWLFPLWDSKRQTLGDKIMGTVVIVVPKQPFTVVPPKT
jgi:uncharacterized RDD family membrane protein YckC